MLFQNIRKRKKKKTGSNDRIEGDDLSYKKKYLNRCSLYYIREEKRKESTVDDQYTQIFFPDNNSEVNLWERLSITLI
jgi:hypothetical protein